MIRLHNKMLSFSFVFVLSLVLILSGCSGNNGAGETAPPEEKPKATEGSNNASETPAAPKEEELEPVTLTWIMTSNPQTDWEAVQKAINDYIKPKINATLEMKFIAGDYAQKINPMVASGEEFDIIWTGYKWKYLENAQKGAFIDMAPLLDKYAPELKASLPQKVWDDATIDGKIYGFTNYQIAAHTPGIVVQKRFADKYNLDISKIKTFKDIEPFLETIKQNEPDVVPFGIQGGFWYPWMHGIDKIGDHTYYYADQKPVKVIDHLQTPEFKEYLSLARSWFEKGYINKDAATVNNLNDVKLKGNVAVAYTNTLKPGFEVGEMGRNGGHEVVFTAIDEPVFNGTQTSMNAISRTSKNPERAMMFLNLVNTDPTLFNMLAFGLEGKHYEKLDGNFIKPIKDSGYKISNWKVGNTFIGYLEEGMPATLNEETLKMNEEARVQTLFGFTLDMNPIKTEIAALDAVDNEYKAAVMSGTVDPNEYLPKWIEARKNAGLERILEEVQKQADAWLAANKK